MPQKAYLKIKGSKQGDIKGSVTAKGFEGQIEVIAVAHEIFSPRDLGAGQAAGRRQHKPIVITKNIDRSTPLLRQSFATGERLTEWLLQFFTKASNGSQKLYFTIKLTDAGITSASLIMPNAQVPETSNLREFEDLTFDYRAITWTWLDGNITAQDSV
jgi:type VI secretion system secreted protein Hcp